MIQAKAALFLAFILPMTAFSLPAAAATAHNLQTGTQTSNAYDTVETAAAKQMHKDQAASGWLGSIEFPAR